MATVTLLQATNMGALPPSMSSAGSNQASAEVDVAYSSTGFSSAYLNCLGAFTGNNALHNLQGTISQVMIDDLDFGDFANLDIVGLSYSITYNYFYTVMLKGNIAQFVGDLLSGDDTIYGSAGADTIWGFQGNDTLIGGAGGDVLNGGGGNDTVSYATAPTGIFAGLYEGGQLSVAEGDSYIEVENLIGSPFNDILYGNDVVNILTGGTGNDQMVGKGGADRFDGGIGNDTVFYDASFPYTANFAIRADLLSPATNTGDAKGDVYISIENLEGSSFDDVLGGNNGPNILRGNHYAGLSGKDQLFGRGGDDQLLGFADNDRLVGGLGRDAMAGGTGFDTFDFNTVAEIGNTAATRDRITDFTHLGDKINLSVIDANGAAANSTAFSFLATMNAAFTGAKGQLRWFQENPLGTVNDKTIIAGDIDGNKVSDFMFELAGLKVLSAADFVL